MEQGAIRSTALLDWVIGRLACNGDGTCGASRRAWYGVTLVDPDQLYDPELPAARLSFLGTTAAQRDSCGGGFDAMVAIEGNLITLLPSSEPLSSEPLSS